MLEESVGDHRHQRVTMKTLPGSSLEVVETEFFFQLLMRLLANPSRFESQPRRAGWSSTAGWRDSIHLPRRAVFADEPGLFARKMLLTLVADPLRWSVGDAHADGGETSFQLPLVPMRQLKFRHGASASMSSADLDRVPEQPADEGDPVRRPARSASRRVDRP